MAMFVSGTTEFYIDIHTRKCFSFRYESISATGTQKIKFLNYNTKETRRFDSFIDSNFRVLILWMKGREYLYHIFPWISIETDLFAKSLFFEQIRKDCLKNSYGLHYLQIFPFMSHKLRTKKHLPPECPNSSHSPHREAAGNPEWKEIEKSEHHWDRCWSGRIKYLGWFIM